MRLLTSCLCNMMFISLLYLIQCLHYHSLVALPHLLSLIFFYPNFQAIFVLHFTEVNICFLTLLLLSPKSLYSHRILNPSFALYSIENHSFFFNVMLCNAKILHPSILDAEAMRSINTFRMETHKPSSSSSGLDG